MAVNVYVFGREDCTFCQLEESFLDAQISEGMDFNLIKLDVTDKKTKEQFTLLTEKYNLTKATPITLAGDSIIQGFNSAEVTGKDILSAIEAHKGKANLTIEDYLEGDRNLSTSSAVCDTENSVTCSVSVQENTEIKVPFFGVIDLKDFSLFSIFYI